MAITGRLSQDFLIFKILVNAPGRPHIGAQNACLDAFLDTRLVAVFLVMARNSCNLGNVLDHLVVPGSAFLVLKFEALTA